MSYGVGGVAFAADAGPSPVALRRGSPTAHLDAMHEDPSSYPRRDVYAAALELCARDPESDALAWRSARAAHQLATEPSTPAAERLKLLTSAAHVLSRVKARTRDDAAVFRWSGIVLSDLAGLQSSGEAIKSAYAISDDFAAAIALDPYDASAHHLLGRWSLSMATMNGWVRSFAALVFAEPPTATLEEARASFVRAESLQPNFWSANQVALADVEERLGNKPDLPHHVIHHARAVASACRRRAWLSIDRCLCCTWRGAPLLELRRRRPAAAPLRR